MDNIKNAKEKQAAYTKEYGRFKKALGSEFYLEAVAIGYAIIEDRLIAFLHHAGIVSRNNDSLKVNKPIYPFVRMLLGKADKEPIRLSNISVKLELVGRLLNMSEDEARQIEERVVAVNSEAIKKRGYMLELYSQINKLEQKSDVLKTLEKIELWKEERNQLIHALLNKTASSSEIAKKDCAECSLDITRNLDNHLVKPFKRGNTLRKRYKIQ